jgi:hypothetical protein
VFVEHRVERVPATGSLGARRGPTGIGEDAQVPAHRALRELQRLRELADHELMAIEGEQQPAARGISQRGESVVNEGSCGRGHI